MALETLVTELINTSATTSGDSSIINTLIGVVLGGGSATGILGVLINKVKKFLDVDDETAGSENVPTLLKVFSGGTTWQMKEEDIAWVVNQLSSFEEQKIIRNEIQSNTDKQIAYFTLDTSVAKFPISQGYIDVANIVYKTTATSESAVKEDNTSINADTNKIGTSTFKEVTLDGTVLKDGGSISQSAVGKYLITSWTPVDYGKVVVGGFWDGLLLSESNFDVIKANIDGNNADVVQFRLPQYKTGLLVGEHVLEFKQGYYSGHDDTKGDQITWKEQLTTTFKVTVTE